MQQQQRAYTHVGTAARHIAPQVCRASAQRRMPPQRAAQQTLHSAVQCSTAPGTVHGTAKNTHPKRSRISPNFWLLRALRGVV